MHNMVSLSFYFRINRLSTTGSIPSSWQNLNNENALEGHAISIINVCEYKGRKLWAFEEIRGITCNHGKTESWSYFLIIENVYIWRLDGETNSYVEIGYLFITVSSQSAQLEISSPCFSPLVGICPYANLPGEGMKHLKSQHMTTPVSCSLFSLFVCKNLNLAGAETWHLERFLNVDFLYFILVYIVNSHITVLYAD